MTSFAMSSREIERGIFSGAAAGITGSCSPPAGAERGFRAAHEARMQNAELGRLAVRGARRDPKPLLVVRHLLHAAQIELGRYAQSRKRVRLAVGGAGSGIHRLAAGELVRDAVFGKLLF